VDLNVGVNIKNFHIIQIFKSSRNGTTFSTPVKNVEQNNEVKTQKSKDGVKLQMLGLIMLLFFSFKLSKN
jgi:hypothetical protein